jgi:hypothetical protein
MESLKPRRVEELRIQSRAVHKKHVWDIIDMVNRGYVKYRLMDKKDPHRDELFRTLRSITAKNKCPIMRHDYNYQFNYKLLHGTFFTLRDSNCKWCRPNHEMKRRHRVSKQLIRRRRLHNESK